MAERISASSSSIANNTLASLGDYPILRLRQRHDCVVDQFRRRMLTKVEFRVYFAVQGPRDRFQRTAGAPRRATMR